MIVCWVPKLLKAGPALPTSFNRQPVTLLIDYILFNDLYTGHVSIDIQ